MSPRNLLLIPSRPPPLDRIPHARRLSLSPRMVIAIVSGVLRRTSQPELIVPRRHARLARVGALGIVRVVRHERGARLRAPLHFGPLELGHDLGHLGEHGSRVLDDAKFVHLVPDYRVLGAPAILPVGMLLVLLDQETAAKPTAWVRVVHDGVGHHVRQLSIELITINNPLWRHDVLVHRKRHVREAWIATGKGRCLLSRRLVPVVDGRPNALEILRLENDLMIPWRISLPDRDGKHTSGLVVDNVLHHRGTRLVEGPRPQDRVGARLSGLC